MQMAILMGIGTSVLLQLLRLPLPPRLLLLLLSTGITHNGARLEQRITGLLYGPGDRSVLSRKASNSLYPACPLFTVPHPTEERHQARNGRAGDDSVERGHQARRWI